MRIIYLIGGFLLVLWIYLIYLLIVVLKKKINIAESRYTMLKTLLLVAIISLPACVAYSIVNAVILYYSGIRGLQYDIISYLLGGISVIATIGSLIIFFRGRRETT